MRIQAKRLVGGRGQGPAMVSLKPISFLGGVAPTTGEVTDAHSPLSGQNMSGRVLAFPGGKGSTVGSYILYGLARRGRAPAAIIVERPDTIVTVGAVIGSIPAVYGIPPDVFQDGEWIEVDGEKATARVRDVISHDIVTCFLRNRGRILLLRRSKKVGTFQGAWAGVSGYVEEDEVHLERALKEIDEETGFSNPMLAKTGEPVYARDGNRLFIVRPYIFDVDTRDVRLDWEHVEYRWVKPADISTFKGVPKLEEAYQSGARGMPARMAKNERSPSS
jgi:predicted aconitase with swiveling domain/8-oxo-dGTP pyrophosphatase MutT (NUDIX family)